MESTSLRVLKICLARNLGRGNGCRDVLDALLVDDESQNQVPSLQKLAAKVVLPLKFRHHKEAIVEELKRGNFNDFAELRHIPFPGFNQLTVEHVPLTTDVLNITLTDDNFTITCSEGPIFDIEADRISSANIQRLIRATFNKNVEMYKFDMRAFALSDFPAFWRNLFGGHPGSPIHATDGPDPDAPNTLYNHYRLNIPASRGRRVEKNIMWLTERPYWVYPPPGISMRDYFINMLIAEHPEGEDFWRQL